MSVTNIGALVVQPFATSGDVTVPPQTDPNGFVNWTQGYTPYYEAELGVGNPQAKAVERPVQNGLFNLITGNIQNWQQLGLAPWQSAMPGGYTQNAQVMRYNSTSTLWVPYRSLVSNNVSDPLVSPTEWEYVPYFHETVEAVPMPSGGSSGVAAEVITVATNLNTLTTGTWQFVSDAVAAASGNSPALSGATTLAGMVESLTWVNGATTYVVQRYLDRAGNAFFRGATNGTWQPWTSVTVSTFSTDVSSTVNLVEATFSLPSATLNDNQQFWVKIAHTNTGAVTFSPNISIIATPLPLVGQALLPLQGGEIFVGGRALILWKADTNNFVLIECTGGSQQTTPATQSNQAVNLSQLLAQQYQFPIPLWAGYGTSPYSPASAINVGDTSAMQFSKSIAQSAFFSMPWIGNASYTLPLKFFLTYTGSVAAGNYYLQMQYQVISANGSMLASYTTTVDTAPGPAAANEETFYKTATAIIPASLLVANCTINVVITRLSTNALDTNTGTMSITNISTSA